MTWKFSSYYHRSQEVCTRTHTCAAPTPSAASPKLYLACMTLSSPVMAKENTYAIMSALVNYNYHIRCRWRVCVPANQSVNLIPRPLWGRGSRLTTSLYTIQDINNEWVSSAAWCANQGINRDSNPSASSGYGICYVSLLSWFHIYVQVIWA